MALRTAHLLLLAGVLGVVAGQDPVFCGDCDSVGHGAGCSVTVIQDCVCAVDTYCCNVAWDSICVNEVYSPCQIDCSGLAHSTCPFDDDGNLEVTYPPLIDEANTRLVLGSTSDMKVTVLVPKQYSTTKFDFEGASDPAGAFDSAAADVLTNPYWTGDELTDPCYVIYTGLIPWMNFRTSLGGITERRFSDAVYYSTEINIEVTKNLTLHPETLLLEEKNPELEQAQDHVRYVRNKIPFEVMFDLEIKLWDSVEVTSDHLRVAAAITDTTVLNVDPDYLPVAKANIDFVTLIPLPLLLTNPTISVSDPDLKEGITIEELVALRNCTESQEICTQFWHVKVYPEQCTLNGIYTANLTGVCHPDSVNCLAPSPSTVEIVMDITSDDYCGITQEVDIVGSLSLGATDCNGFMHGTIEVSNPEGGAINHTQITQVEVSPTLLDSQIFTVFDGSTALLNYTSHPTYPHTVDFYFQWLGNELRCDVIASVDVMVLVEFEATRSLQILSLSSGSAEKGEKSTVLQQTDYIDEYSMRMLSHASVAAGSDDEVSPSDADGTLGDVSGNGDGSAASSAMLTATSVLICLIVALAGGALVFAVRARRQKRARGAHAAAGVSPRNRKSLPATVTNRLRGGNVDEHTPLATPQAGGNQFFHDE